MKILIADDHSLIIEGFITVLKRHDPSIGCYTATDKKTLFELLSTQEISVLFQDIFFGKDDARDFMNDLKERYPLLKIIVISTLNNPSVVETLFKQGVDGYLVKSDASREIVKALETILQERKYISQTISGNCNSTSLRDKGIILTPREKEILCLILQEKTTKEISEEIFLSEKTIENHRANLFIKFGAKNMAGLVKAAVLEGFL